MTLGSYRLLSLGFTEKKRGKRERTANVNERKRKIETLVMKTGKKSEFNESEKKK